jgi:hypothetical protein
MIQHILLLLGMLLAARAQDNATVGDAHACTMVTATSACCDDGYLYSIGGITPAQRRLEGHSLCLYISQQCLFPTHCLSWWPYTDVAGKFLYFFQITNGGLATTTTNNGITCTLPNAGYVVRSWSHLFASLISE